MNDLKTTIHDAELYTGCCLDILAELPEKSVNTCITSPPYYGLRDYGNDGQIGLEETPDDFVRQLVEVFRGIHRVLRDDGTLWLNLGDSYVATGDVSAGGSEKQRSNQGANNFVRNQTTTLRPKNLLGIPWRVALALQDDGWFLRQDIIWSKPNPMPESVTDRCTKAHEYIFLLTKGPKYYYDQQSIVEPVTQSTVNRLNQPNIENQTGSDRVPGKNNGTMKAVPGKQFGDKKHTNPKYGGGGSALHQEFGYPEPDGTPEGTRNKRSVWTVTTKPFSGAHFATFPPDLIEPCVMAGCPSGGTVLDPFSGSGTTGQVALTHGRKYIGIELNPEYQKMAIERITPFARQGLLF